MSVHYLSKEWVGHCIAPHWLHCYSGDNLSPFGLFGLVSNHISICSYIYIYVSINVYLPTHSSIYLNYYELSLLLILTGYLDKGISQMMFRFPKLSSINYVLGDENRFTYQTCFPFECLLQSITIGSDGLIFPHKGHTSLPFIREWGQDRVTTKVSTSVSPCLQQFS